MSSPNKVFRGRKAMSYWSWLGVIIIIFIVIIFSYRNADALTKAKFSCKGSIGVAKLFCVREEANCPGSIERALSCPDDKPFCCASSDIIEEEPGTAPVQQPSAGTPVAKGDVELYCKCKVEDGSLVATDTYAKLEIGKLTAGGTDFKVTGGTELQIQARGTQDVKYCRISAPGKESKGDCSQENGPVMAFKFAQAETDISIYGYDRKDGTRMASAVADFTAESAIT